MTASHPLLAIAFLGLGLAVLQHLVLRRHRSERPGLPATLPGISVLKPLCGVDEGLAESLAAFAALDYPRYEVVLGVRDRRDAAWPVAEAAVAQWPGRFRLVIQRGEPGLNPKVNQLLGMAEAARHDVLVVSDSNVRVPPGYLRDVAARLRDERVGLVTHAVVGVGERSLGATLENLHLPVAVDEAAVVGGRRVHPDGVEARAGGHRHAPAPHQAPRGVVPHAVVVAGDDREAAGVEERREDTLEPGQLVAAAAVGDVAGEEDVVHAGGLERLDEAPCGVVGGLVAADVEVGDVGEGPDQARLLPLGSPHG
jgi:hypothetical protein